MMKSRSAMRSLHDDGEVLEVAAPFRPNSQELSERVCDIEEYLARCDSQLHSLQGRVVTLKSDHEAHLTNSNDTFSQIASLLATTASLTESFKSFEHRTFGSFQKEFHSHRTEWLQAAASQTKEFEGEVKNLLCNFRSEVIAIARESEGRHEEHRMQLDFLAEKLSATTEAQTTLRGEHDKLLKAVTTVTDEFQSLKETVTKRLDTLEASLTRSVDQAIATTTENREELRRMHTNTQQLFSLCKEECNRHSEECQLEVSNTLEGKLIEVDERHNKARESLYREVGADIDGARATLNNNWTKEMAAVQQKIDEHYLQASQTSARVADLREAHEKGVMNFVRNVGTLEGELRTQRDRLTEVHTTVRDTLGAALEEVQQAVAEVNSKMGTIDQSVVTVTGGLQLVTSAHEKEEKALAELEKKLEGNTRQFQETVRGLLETQREVQAEQLKKMEGELERRHRKMLETTHQAIEELTVGNTDVASNFQSIRGEVQGLAEVVRSHTALIETHTLDGTVDGSFAEVKDWINAVEQRTISRAEVEEAVLKLTSQVQSLRQSTQSAEAALGQRLDAERVARERDATHHRTQLQRFTGNPSA